MEDLEIIRSLLYSDMKERLDSSYTTTSGGERSDALVNAIAECCDMSDINSLLSIYSHLFKDDQLNIPIASIQGTQNYVMRLLTRRIANDDVIIHNWNLGVFDN